MLYDSLRANFEANDKTWSAYFRQQRAEFVADFVKAQRFAFDDLVAQAAQDIAESGSESLAKALPLCRLPFPMTWLEMPMAPLMQVRGEVISPGTLLVKRFGWLIRALDPSMCSGVATMIWSLHGGDKYNTSGFCFVFDCRNNQDACYAASTWLDQETFNAFVTKREHSIAEHDDSSAASAAIERHGMIAPSPYCREAWDELRLRLDAHAQRIIMADWLANWTGEARLLLASLAFLNSKRSVDIQLCEPSRARKQSRRGKALYSYHNVRLVLPAAAMARMSESADSRDPMRAHLVRGHFKVRKSGMFFWRPFVRGDVAKGFVDKSYSATRAT